MVDPHTHDYWATPFGPLTCACGDTKEPPPPKEAA